MKKAVAAVAACMMSAAMIASFAACAPEKSALERAQEMSSERLGSREEWEAAFADPTQGAEGNSYTFNNANYRIESEMRASASNASVVVERDLVVGEEKVYLYQQTDMYIGDSEEVAQSLTQEDYYAADASRYEHYYRDDDGVWAMTTVSSIDLALLYTSTHTDELTEYADDYDAFVWNDEKQGYCRTVSLTGLLDTTVTATLTLKFQGGKIAAIMISDSSAAEGAALSSTVEVGVIISYNGQKVSLPVVGKA